MLVAATCIPTVDAAALYPMIGLSVAVGRFVEALFWAIFRVAGAVAGAVVLAILVAIVAWIVIRRIMRRR
ncbi:hypothetical protein [Sphingomonas sp. Leaf339]|uniref:hypothetical protein n=1 Tax=Sphingomonas sp. Leaf339 TaxID=1736343 RepID=UPI001F2E9C3D|nr:hypothetical protein [Sphingomonas sp. Leaf339]